VSVSYASLPALVRETAERELTRKQLDVFKLHCAGCSYARISTMLMIGVSTVKGHLHAAHLHLEKAGVVRTDFRAYSMREEAA